MRGVEKMAEQHSVLPRLLQLTALGVFAFGLWELWLYVTSEPNPIYDLYAMLAAVIIGMGIFCFDEVFKPKDEYVGWSLLLGTGVLALVVGLFFLFVSSFNLDLRSITFLVMGIIIVAEGVTVKRRIVTPGEHGVEAKTLAPILLKMTGILVIAWGVYQLAWSIADIYGLISNPFTFWQLILGVGSVIVGGFHVVYVESQKRNPVFHWRRSTLLVSFILIVLGFLTTGVYLEAPTTLILPITLAFGAALVAESFYLINYPTKPRG